jgi:hypothetical protein
MISGVWLSASISPAVSTWSLTTPTMTNLWNMLWSPVQGSIQDGLRDTFSAYSFWELLPFSLK